MERDITIHSSNPSAKGSLIVEFVGLPGVGKSTLSRRTAATIASDHPRVTEPISRIENRSGPSRILSKGRYAAEHTLRHPRTAIDGLRTIRETEQPTTIDFVRVVFNFQYVAGVVTRGRSTAGITLLDQGPYQALWSIGLRSPVDWSDLFDRFENPLSRIAPDLVVLVEADTETIADRLRSREGGDTRVGPGTAEFDRGVDGYDYLKERIQSSDRTESIVVENETRADLTAGASRIADAINSLED